MTNWGLNIGNWWYIWLLAIVPVLWIFSYRSLSGLGKWRRIFALAIRTIVLLLVILALAEIQLLWKTDRMTVLYLLDQSQSIPSAKRAAMMEYAIREVKEHRNEEREDRAGVIVFGSFVFGIEHGLKHLSGWITIRSGFES